jgi:hypothetical protein
MRLLIAYLDPGSGSLFLQGGVAVAATAMISIGSFWGFIKSFTAKLFGNKAESGK